MNRGDMTSEQFDRAVLYVADHGSPPDRRALRALVAGTATNADLLRLEVALERVPDRELSP